VAISSALGLLKEWPFISPLVLVSTGPIFN